MSTKTKTAPSHKKEPTVEEKIAKLRRVFADAPDVGKKALDKVLGGVSRPRTGRWARS